MNIYDMADEWADAGIVFTAIKMDVTDTASAAGSALMRLLLNGVDELALYRDGGNTVFELQNGSASILGNSGAGGRMFLRAGGATCITLTPGNVQLNTGTFLLGPNSSNPTIRKDGPQAVEVVWGTNPMSLYASNTFTDVNNYERGGFKWDSNVLEVVSEAIGTGVRRSVMLNGANRAAKISDPSGGSTVDSEARTAINAIIDALEAHGLSAVA